MQGHPDVNCVNLTGSVAAGKALAREAGYKKLLFELGGNDPLIVCADANVALAAQQAVDGRFGTAGQRCTAPKRVFVHASVMAEFRDRVVALTAKLRVGDPALEETDVGPVVHSRAADAVWARLQSALTASGGKALIGNRREGNLIWPSACIWKCSSLRHCEVDSVFLTLSCRFPVPSDSRLRARL